MASGTFFSKPLLNVRFAPSTMSRNQNLFIYQHYPSVFLSVKCISSNAKASKESFTVSYLVSTCGLSPESAVSISKNIQLKSPEKADLILNFLKNQGFSKSQIVWLIRGLPTLFNYVCPEKTLLPKIEFFLATGMSRSDVLTVLSSEPGVLGRSLKGFIIPNYDFIKSLLGSDKRTITAIKRCPRILSRGFQSYLTPNMAFLQQLGVSESNIKFLLSNYPRTFYLRPGKFQKIALKVKQMGINPLRMSFVVAVKVKSSMTDATWEMKLSIYKHWGLSEAEIHSAFIKFPSILALSKDKIMATMDFLFNEMGWSSVIIIQYPQIVGLSLKKRIIPRCLVVKILQSKGLISKKITLSQVLWWNETMFLQKFVTCYKDEAPHLLKVYQEALGDASHLLKVNPSN